MTVVSQDRFHCIERTLLVGRHPETGGSSTGNSGSLNINHEYDTLHTTECMGIYETVNVTVGSFTQRLHSARLQAPGSRSAPARPGH